MRLSSIAVAMMTAALMFYVFGATSIVRGLAWAGLGACIGWLGSLVLRTDTQRGILLDILAGAVGSLCGLLVYGGGSLTEGGPVERILSSILGSVVLIAVAGLLHRTTGAKRSSDDIP